MEGEVLHEDVLCVCQPIKRANVSSDGQIGHKSCELLHGLIYLSDFKMLKHRIFGYLLASPVILTFKKKTWLREQFLDTSLSSGEVFIYLSCISDHNCSNAIVCTSFIFPADDKYIEVKQMNNFQSCKVEKKSVDG